MAIDLYESLREVVTFLDIAEIDYALAGGLALAVHGHARATTDIDLLILPEDADAAIDAAKDAGFQHVALPMTFSDGMTLRRATRIADNQALTLDLLLVHDALRPVWAGRERHTIDWGTLTVVSREGLILMKVAAGRPQDLADIDRLTEADR